MNGRNMSIHWIKEFNWLIAKIALIAQKKKAKSKKKKDPNAPKKPPSGFILYFISRKDKVQEMNPRNFNHFGFIHLELKMPEVTKIIGKEWKDLTLEKKAVY